MPKRKVQSAMLTGVILAGSVAAEPGGQRLSDELETLMKTHVQRMSKVCSEIIISTNNPKPFLLLFGSRVRIVTDYFPHQGPLAGLHASLSLARNAAAWVVDGQLSAVSVRTASLLLREMAAGNWEAALPVLNGRIQYFHGVYRKDVSDRAAQLLCEQRGDMDAFVQRLHVATVTEDTLRRKGVKPDTLNRIGASRSQVGCPG
jgi:molybdopterin-guanine dinucleotide biosynthesis protein A